MDEDQKDNEKNHDNSENRNTVLKQICSIEEIVDQVTAKPTKKYIFMMLGLMCFNIVGEIFSLPFLITKLLITPKHR